MSCSIKTGNFTQGRTTQMNNYEFERETYVTAAMMRYSYILLYLIVVLIFRNADIFSNNVFSWLFIPVAAYLGLDMLYSFHSYSKRGPVNFDTYIWSFDKHGASAQTNGSIVVAPGAGAVAGAGAGVMCSNSACCQPGMLWDASIGKCTVK